MLSETMGERAVSAAFAKQAESINATREHNLLTVRPGAGLAFGTSALVPRHVPHGIE